MQKIEMYDEITASVHCIAEEAQIKKKSKPVKFPDFKSIRVTVWNEKSQPQRPIGMFVGEIYCAEDAETVLLVQADGIHRQARKEMQLILDRVKHFNADAVYVHFTHYHICSPYGFKATAEQCISEIVRTLPAATGRKVGGMLVTLCSPVAAEQSKPFDRLFKISLKKVINSCDVTLECAVHHGTTVPLQVSDFESVEDGKYIVYIGT